MKVKKKVKKVKVSNRAHAGVGHFGTLEEALCRLVRKRDVQFQELTGQSGVPVAYVRAC